LGGIEIHKKVKKASILAGKVKVWQSRLATYISMVNFAMIFYLYIIETPMGLKWWHWLLIIVITTLVTVYVDTKFIFPTSQAYTFNKNPEMMRLKKKTEENNKILLEIKKELSKR